MRSRTVLSALAMCLLLTACLGGLVARAGTEILLAFLKPMVGLDPNANSVFEHPIIRERMQAFLGPQYEPVMQLLKTANELQQEGPLFYVVSRYTPVPEFAEKAGFVWNSETNQMALMLVSGGSPTVLAEKLAVNQANRMAQELVPQWPGELQAILDEEALKKRALESAGAAAGQALGVDPALQAPLGQVLQGEAPAEVLQQQVDQQVEAAVRSSVEQISTPALPPAVAPDQALEARRREAEQALEAELQSEEGQAGHGGGLPP